MAHAAGEAPQAARAGRGAHALVVAGTGARTTTQDSLVAFVRAFGLHQPETTPCGQPIPVSEAHAIAELAQAGTLGQLALGQRLNLQKSTVSRLVTQLLTRGWVQREADQNDGRASRLRLTTAGEQACVQPRSSAASSPASLPTTTARSSTPSTSSRRHCVTPAPEPPDRLGPAHRPATVAAATAVVAAALTLVATCAPPGTGDTRTARQAEVAEAGVQVMPFDLDRTTHVFTALPTGGDQTVTADDPADTEQITLIRQHLRTEAERFRRADFGDPATIHGQNMPGLAELRGSAGRIEVVYTELGDGALLSYRTSDPALIAALHDWFAAQTSDHGGHAR